MSATTPRITNLMHISEWGEHHSVIPEFLDFEYTDFNPVEVLEAINDTVAETPNTTKFIRASEIVDRVENQEQFSGGSIPKLTVLMSLHGAWQSPTHSPGNTVAYINPEYVHLDHLGDEFFLTDAEERNEFLDIALKHGRLWLPDLATAFNIKRDSAQKFVSRHLDQTWTEHRKQALTRTACTWRTLQDWGYDTRRLAEAFNMDVITFRTTIHRRLPDDFETPEKPTHDPESQQQFDYRELGDYRAD